MPVKSAGGRRPLAWQGCLFLSMVCAAISDGRQHLRPGKRTAAAPSYDGPREQWPLLRHLAHSGSPQRQLPASALSHRCRSVTSHAMNDSQVFAIHAMSVFEFPTLILFLFAAVL